MKLKFNLSRPCASINVIQSAVCRLSNPVFDHGPGYTTHSQLYYNNNNTMELGEVVLSCSFARVYCADGGGEGETVGRYVTGCADGGGWPDGGAEASEGKSKSY